MNTEGVKMFRNAIGGFNRDDVTNYIKETDLKHTEALSKITAELEKANSENERCAGEFASKLASMQTLIDEQAAALAESQKQLIDKDAIIELLTQDVTKFSAENERIKAELSGADTKIAELTEQCDSLQTKISTIELDVKTPDDSVGDLDDHNSPAYKLDMYDKISSQLGDIIINANRSADEILNSAREEAEKLRIDTEIECEQKRAECISEVSRIRNETEEEAMYIRDRLSSTANSLLSEVSSDLHSNIENCIREIGSGITDMQYEIRSLLSKISNRSNEMNERIGYYQSCVSDGIADKLSEMDEKYGIKKSKGSSSSSSGTNES